MGRPPMAKLAHQRNQFAAGLGQRIGYLWRNNSLSCPAHDPIRRKLAELRSKNLFADPRHKVAQLRETPRTKPQVPHDEDLPFAAQNVDRALHRTAMIVFHTAPRAYKIVRTSSALQILIPSIASADAAPELNRITQSVIHLPGERP